MRRLLPRVERGSSVAVVVAGALLAATALTFGHAALHVGEARRLGDTRALAEALDLTDLALFTEARYARHLSQADLFTAFQDGPLSIEHFPAGSLVAPARGFPPAGFLEPEGGAP